MGGGHGDSNRNPFQNSKDKKTAKSRTEITISNKGRKIDITPSDNHSTTTKNPGYRGPKNSSIDILDKNGKILTRRWFDQIGRAFRDVDMTNHGNPKIHTEWPHEHTWRYDASGMPIRK